MDLVQLIKHPERMDKETLYDLRSLIALHPYYQTARLLMLQNLYILHDPTFDEELRKAAIYITDRKVIFNLVEAAHYKLRNPPTARQGAPNTKERESIEEDRTALLIDNFLDTIPAENEEEEHAQKKRKPTPADATTDYVSYLLETEEAAPEDTPLLKGQALIDQFLYQSGGKIELSEEPLSPPENEETPEEESESNTLYYTETLARIYIQQGKYQRALEIIKHLNLNNSKKNAYFADQMRFLQKLIRNDNAKKTDKN